LDFQLSIDPVHLFTHEALGELFCDRFDIISTWMYHELSPATVLDRLLLRDLLINLPFLKSRFGGNIMVIARRKEEARQSGNTCVRKPSTDIPQINGRTSLNLPSLGRSDKPAPSPPAFDRCLGTRPTPSRARNSAVAVIKTHLSLGF
jgi:hypothetical protein